MTNEEILKRAIEIIKGDKLENPCHPYCLRCAISQARSEIDIEQGTTFSNTLDGDISMLECIRFIEEYDDVKLTKTEALKYLEKFL